VQYKIIVVTLTDTYICESIHFFHMGKEAEIYCAEGLDEEMHGQTSTCSISILI